MPSTLRQIFVAALLAGFCIAGHAACDTGLAERMHAKLHPKRQLDHERAVCVPWRGFIDRFIVVLPLPQRSFQPGVTEFDLDVLVVQQADNGNTERAKVVSRLFERNALKEDAVRISEIRVDTSRYKLAQDVRAFGIRIFHRGSSHANPYSDDTLMMYVPQGPNLAKVLDELQVTQERGAWDTNCAGDFETARGHVSVSHITTNGYADLVLRQTISETRSSVQDNECVTTEEPARFAATTLRYDGKAYRSSSAATTASN